MDAQSIIKAASGAATPDSERLVRILLSPGDYDSLRAMADHSSTTLSPSPDQLINPSPPFCGIPVQVSHTVSEPTGEYADGSLRALKKTNTHP